MAVVRKILINGGCGFLGSNLAAAGLERGFDVTVLDNLSRTGSAENLSWLQAKGGKYTLKHTFFGGLETECLKLKNNIRKVD